MDEITLKTEALDLIAYGNSFLAIRDQDEYVLANEYLTQNKRKQKIIAEYFDPEIESANKTHKGLCAKKKVLLDPLQENYKRVANAAGAYLTEQEMLRQKEQARLEEEARKKAQTAQATIIAAAEKEEKAGDLQCAADLMEQAADIEPEQVNASPVVKNFRGTAGATFWGTDLQIEVINPAEVYKAVMAGELPINCVEISVKIGVLKKHFEGKSIKIYNANGLQVKEIKVPRVR